jgi:hypothetical protein
MLDSYHPSQIGAAAAGEADGLAALGAGVFAAAMELGDGDGDGPPAIDLGQLVDDARMTATAFYMGLMDELELQPLAAPVLLATASEPLGDVDPEADGWRPRWELPHELLEVPGNHLSMMDAHAETTAEAISRWIGTALGAARDTQANEGEEVRR